MRRLIQKLGLLLFVFLLIVLLGYGYFHSHYVPLLCRMAQEQAQTAALAMIDSVIDEKIETGNIRYDRIIFFEKDTGGKITALKTNMQEVNRLKSVILRDINDTVFSADQLRMGISLGTLFLPEFLSGVGPEIPVHIHAIQKSTADFSSRFSQAGINQTLHQLYMRISIEGNLLVFGEIRPFTAASQVLVAETVIVGEVPNTFS